MSRALWVLLGVAAVTATLAGQGGAASTASPGDGKAKAEAADGAAGAYEELLLARAPLLLEVRLLRARRRLFEVAADPQKGEQLERDIKAAFARVVALYERYLKEHPDDARAHYGFGVLCYWEGEDERRAEAHWLRTIELDPGYDLAHNALAVHYADAGEPDKALKHISKALSLNPGVAMYHFNAATFYFNFRKPAMRMFGWDLGRDLGGSDVAVRGGHAPGPGELRLRPRLRPDLLLRHPLQGEARLLAGPGGLGAGTGFSTQHLGAGDGTDQPRPGLLLRRRP